STVSNRIRPAAIRPYHATNFGCRRWVDREEKSRTLNDIVEVHPGHAGLYNNVHVFLVKCHYFVHIDKVNTDSTKRCGKMSFETGPSGEWYNRYPVVIAYLTNFGDVLGRLRVDHCEGKPFTVDCGPIRVTMNMKIVRILVY